MENRLWNWDLGLFRDINLGWHSPFLDPIFFVISSTGLGWVQVVIILICFPWKAFLGLGIRTSPTGQTSPTSQTIRTSLANIESLPSAGQGFIPPSPAREVGELANREGGIKQSVPLEERQLKKSKYDLKALLTGKLGIAPLLLYAWAFTGIVDTLIKHAVPRDRPSNESWAMPQEDVHAWSFASGHTASAFGLAWVIFFMTRGTPYSKWGWAALVWGLLVGVSRVYRGVHWPSDVASGFCVGLMCACLFMAAIGLRVKGKGVEAVPESDTSSI